MHQMAAQGGRLVLLCAALCIMAYLAGASRAEGAPLDANSVVVTTGLKAGDRVVTQGASLLAQVR